uniref:Uncharacterized protein n=1 Tax=Schizaphis graminum TaxID=13262 RepID=A0A2S2NYN7_SCHGA
MRSNNFILAVICSLHFAPYHYNNNSTDKCKLKPHAIPLSLNGIDYSDVPFISTTPIKEPSKSPVNDKLEVITTPSGKFYVENIIPDPNSLPENLTLSKNVSRKRLFDGKKSLSISEDLGVEPLILVNDPIEEQIYK